MFGLFRRKKVKGVRPLTMNDYIGQERAKLLLNIAMTGAKRRCEPLEHVVIYGPPGLGKTTLAQIIANEMGVKLISGIGTTLQSQTDLLSMFDNVYEGDVVFIDEIHRLPIRIEELLYTAMEDNYINVGNNKITLPKFTLIGATTKVGDLSEPLRDRFGHQLRLDYYSNEELGTVMKRTANILGMQINDDAIKILAGSARGTPRIANTFVKRAIDIAQAANETIINETVALATLKLLGIDGMGLNDMDRRILRVLVEDYNCTPVGINTIATCVGENAKTIQEVYEPYLITKKLVLPTSRGRVATELAKEYVKGGLFNDNI
jgi:Holliday junction DNA helicase RuvB